MSFTKLSHFKSTLDERQGTRADSSALKPLVLLIDDDAGLRASMMVALSRDFRFACAASADEGIAAVDAQVAAVLLDIKMAGKDGFAAYSEIRQKDPDLPTAPFAALPPGRRPSCRGRAPYARGTGTAARHAPSWADGR